MPQKSPKSPAEMVAKAEEKSDLKNHNPNQNHNTQKESLGQNTKR